MITLILDTSHKYLAVGICKDNQILASKQEMLKQKQSEYLISYINDMLQEAKIDKSDIDKIVVTDGPGSYTGLRIALTFVKVFALVQNVEVYTINTLLSLIGNNKGFVLLDARSKRVFGAKVDNMQLFDQKIYMLDELKEIQEDFYGDVSLLGLEEKEISVIQNIIEVQSQWKRVDNIDTLSPRY